jgi:tetratricopeptide (TPR) repeat protein
MRSRRDLEAAIRACQEALELDPTHPWAHVLLGEVYADTGRPEEARQHLERASALHPENPNVQKRLQSLQRRGQRQQASRPRPGHAAVPDLVAAPPREAEPLRLAYSLKERAEKLLARLEDLRATDDLSGDECSAMRTRYQDALARARSQIDTLKEALGRRREDRERDAERESGALEQLQDESSARQLLDYQVADQRRSIEQRLAAARAQVEAITRILSAEFAADLGGLVEVNLATGEPESSTANTSSPGSAYPVRLADDHCECGAALQPGARFCDRCGRVLPPESSAALALIAAPVAGVPDVGVDHPPPAEAMKWNWGAFLLSLFWTPAHNLWGWFVVFLVLEVVLSLAPLALVGRRAGPIVLMVALTGMDLAASIYLGINGGRLAWARRRFSSVEDFIGVQRIWAWVGLAYLLVCALMGVILAVIGGGGLF